MNIPVLRFPEFKDNWERTKFGEFVIYKSSKYDPSKETESYKCIELEHIKSGDGQLLGFVESKGLGSIKNKFDKGDVLFGKLRPYLKKYLQAPFDGVCSSEIWVLKGTKVSNDFLYRIIQTNFFIEIANQSTGSKMPRADWEVVSNNEFLIPSLPEQKKITNFFTAVDDKLKAIKQKKSLLEQYKKGLMQKIFSQELRFKDNNGLRFPDWVEKRLGDIAEIKGGKRIPKGLALEEENNGFPYITVSDMENSTVSLIKIRYVPLSVVEKIKNYRILTTDIYISVAGTLGLVGIIPPELENANLTENANKITNLKCDQKFLLQFLKSDALKKLVENVGTVGAQPKLAIYAITDFIVPLPVIQEQIKIANFLSALDIKINRCSVLIEKTELWKKGLLQKMFV